MATSRTRADIETDLAAYTRQARRTAGEDHEVIHAILDDLLTDWQRAGTPRPSQVLARR